MIQRLGTVELNEHCSRLVRYASCSSPLLSLCRTSGGNEVGFTMFPVCWVWLPPKGGVRLLLVTLRDTCAINICKVGQSNWCAQVGISWRDRCSRCCSEWICANSSESIWTKVLFEVQSIDVDCKLKELSIASWKAILELVNRMNAS